MYCNKRRITLKTITRFAVFIGIIALSITTLGSSTAFGADEVQRTVNKAVDTLKPALVRIHVVSTDDRDGREVKEEAFGSGVIISPDGYVITNHHVAGHAKMITCTMWDKTEIEAKLIGSDALTDIAVIQLLPTEKRTFEVAKFGDSSKVRVGERVLAMGCPLALSQSVTMGIVSNTEMVMPPIMMGALTMDGEDVAALVRWIGHDATINPGNSGGPLVNLQGEIIGINEIEMGLGGAIPGNLAHDVAEQLIKDKKIKRSWMGFTVQPLLKSSNYKAGVLVSTTIPGSPAGNAGLKTGDILIRLAGKDVTVRFPEERPIFNQYSMSLPIGKEVEAVVIRDGKEKVFKLTPAERPDAQARAEEFTDWGITASNITLIAAKESKRPRTNGALVTSVRPGGPAGIAKPEITEGDIIVTVAGKSVESITELRKITKEAIDGNPIPVAVLVVFDRDQKQFLSVVRIGLKEIKDPGLEVAKAWLPVNTQVVTTDIAKMLNLGDVSGVRITQVYVDSAAEKAGLKVGDIITAIDGLPVSASQPEDTEVFPAMIRQYKIGNTAELSILRDGKETKISVKLPQSPKLPREMKKYQDINFDFTVRDIAFLDRANANWSASQSGVLVESVGQGGWAALGRLMGGDLIIAVDDKPIQDVASMQKVMDDITTRKPKSVVFEVQRGIGQHFVEIEPYWKAD